MESEKAGYASGDTPPYEKRGSHNAEELIENKGLRIGEAADNYGDLQTAEEYGYVSRGYVARR